MLYNYSMVKEQVVAVLGLIVSDKKEVLITLRNEPEQKREVEWSLARNQLML